MSQYRTESKVISFSSDSIELPDAHCIGHEKISLIAYNSFKGSGILEAPEIKIKTKKFDFKGTIRCDKQCEIIVGEPFDDKMFKQEGKGAFRICVRKMPEPIQYSSGEVVITLRDELEQKIAVFMKSDDLSEFDALLQKTAIDQDQYESLLFLAVFFNAYKIAHKICEVFSVKTCQNENEDESALMLAVHKDDCKMVKILVSHGANVNMKYSLGVMNVLAFAASRGSLDIVKVLVEAGADINARLIFSQQTPLQIAESNGHYKVAAYLRSCN